MISEYKFYYTCSEYIVNMSEETYSINGHKVSKYVYNKLYYRLLRQYELWTTQKCFWKNHISKANSFSKLTTLKRKED